MGEGRRGRNLFRVRLLSIINERILFEVRLTPVFRQKYSNMFGFVLGQSFCVNQFTHKGKLAPDVSFEVTPAP